MPILFYLILWLSKLGFLGGHQCTGSPIHFPFTYDPLLGLTVESATVIDFEGLLYKHW